MTADGAAGGDYYPGDLIDVTAWDPKTGSVQLAQHDAFAQRTRTLRPTQVVNAV